MREYFFVATSLENPNQHLDEDVGNLEVGSIEVKFFSENEFNLSISRKISRKYTLGVKADIETTLVGIVRNEYNLEGYEIIVTKAAEEITPFSISEYSISPVPFLESDANGRKLQNDYAVIGQNRPDKNAFADLNEYKTPTKEFSNTPVTYFFIATLPENDEDFQDGKIQVEFNANGSSSFTVVMEHKVFKNGTLQYGENIEDLLAKMVKAEFEGLKDLDIFVTEAQLDTPFSIDKYSFTPLSTSGYDSRKKTLPGKRNQPSEYKPEIQSVSRVLFTGGSEETPTEKKLGDGNAAQSQLLEPAPSLSSSIRIHKSHSVSDMDKPRIKKIERSASCGDLKKNIDTDTETTNGQEFFDRLYSFDPEDNSDVASVGTSFRESSRDLKEEKPVSPLNLMANEAEPDESNSYLNLNGVQKADKIKNSSSEQISTDDVSCCLKISSMAGWFKAYATPISIFMVAALDFAAANVAGIKSALPHILVASAGKISIGVAGFACPYVAIGLLALSLAIFLYKHYQRNKNVEGSASNKINVFFSSKFQPLSPTFLRQNVL